MIKINRKPELVLMNVLFCMLVIFIHVSSAPVTYYDKSSFQYAIVLIPWRLSAFVVQGFIFLSGLKAMLKMEQGIDYKKFYLTKLTRIVIPYLLWNIVYYLYFIKQGYFAFSIPELLTYFLNGTLVSPFYFIVIIVQFYTLMPLWLKIVKTVPPAVSLVVAFLLTYILGRYLPNITAWIFPGYSFQFADRILTTYLFYWIAGCYVGVYYTRAKELLSSKRNLVSALFVLFMLLESTLCYLSFSGHLIFRWLEEIHYLYCISAVSFVFMAISLFYENRALRSRLVKSIDTVSYSIYLMHCLMIYIINDVLWRFGITGISASYLIRILFVYSVTVGLCLVWKTAKDKVYDSLYSEFRR